MFKVYLFLQVITLEWLSLSQTSDFKATSRLLEMMGTSEVPLRAFLFSLKCGYEPLWAHMLLGFALAHWE